MVPAALFGAAFGLLRMPTWHVAVESAQVLAGLVSYPADNPFYLYHVSTWTLLHQVAALLLLLLPSEAAVSYLYSAGLGALTSAALALAAYAVCKRIAVALFVPLFALAVYGGSDVYGIAYPVYLAGSHHTYGVAGRGYALLVLALVGLRRDRTAALLAGLFPAVHVTWAVFTWCVLGATALLNRSAARATVDRTWKWFAAGFVVAASSYGVHDAVYAPVPGTDRAGPLIEAFLEHWDGHRQAIRPEREPGFALAMGVLVLAATLVFRDVRDKRKPRTRFAVLAGVAGVFGVVGVLFTHVQDYFPTLLQLLMPGRFLNILVLAHPAVLIAFAARFVDRTWARIPFALFLVYPIGLAAFRVFLSSDRFGWDLPHAYLFHFMLIPLVLGANWRWILANRTKNEPYYPVRKRRFFESTYPALVCVVVAIGLFTVSVYPKPSSGPPVRGPIMEHLSYADGLIITPSAMELVQLRTGRPILVNTGALDQIAYVPRSAPAIRHILDRVYGVDLLNPPERVRDLRPGALPPGIEDELWTERSSEEWTAIGEEFSAVTVFARDDCPLDLPALYTAGGFTAYAIPAENN